MFRRRPDLSWPLIVLLFGLFVLSLRMPREWAQIARPSRLVLLPRVTATIESTSPNCIAEAKPLVPPTFRSVEPAAPIGNQVAGGNKVEAAAKIQAPAPVAVASASQTLSLPETPLTPVPVAKGVEIAIAPTQNAGGAAQPALAANQVEPTTSAEVSQPNNDEVRVSRDVPVAAESVAAVPQEQPASALPAFGRPAVPEPVTASVDANSQASQVAEAKQPSSPATIPEPSAAVAQPLPAVDQAPSVVRPVAPEPQSAVADSASNIASPPPRQTALARSVSPEEQGQSLPLKAIGRAWEEPSYLLAQLEQLKKHAPAQAWATETIAKIRLLGPAIAVGAPQTAEILRRLEELSQEATATAMKMDDTTVAQELASVAHALARRIVIWKQIGRMGGMIAADAPAPTVDARSLNKALADMEKLTANSPEGHAWRKYLLIDSLREWAARRRNNDERMPRELAQQVYTRLNRMSMTSLQRQFLTSGPAAALNREMLRHTAEAVDSNRLLQHLENFERTGLPSDARVLARDCQYLSVNSGAAQRELGELVEMYFRNANIRVAMSAELINRMMPKREPEYAPVQDVIQGATVRGQSVTANEISVRLTPNPHAVRMALEVNGEVAAATRSTSGPATFYTESESSYFASKPLEVTLRGITMWPTEVKVDNNSKVRGISTEFDHVPLLGQVARRVSVSQYVERRPAADAEVREKIAAKAKQRVDSEATEQVTAAAKRLHDELLGPMDSLMLDPLMISAETTETRFNMRVRLAGPDQLGGHTPRPQAPADSLASVQVHESLVNNMLERLELDGQTFDLASLNRRLAERIHRFQPKPVDPDQEDVKITFAAKDAVHVRLNDGRLEITLAIARLSKGARRFKDFQVRASYKPTVEGRSIDLTREGIVQLLGPRMNVGAQVVLRSVFLKIFSDKRPLHVMPESFVKNAKLNGIVVTQFVIDDGWIGAALGPQRSVAAQGTETR